MTTKLGCHGKIREEIRILTKMEGDELRIFGQNIYRWK